MCLGEHGHLVAAFVQERLPIFLAAEANLKTNPHKSITAAVKKMCAELRLTNIKLAFSGTTCVFSVKIDNIMYVANIGDSRCVLAQDNKKGGVDALAVCIITLITPNSLLKACSKRYNVYLNITLITLIALITLYNIYINSYHMIISRSYLWKKQGI